jgi:hypothetical protein
MKRAEQVIEDAADPPGRDPGLDGIALGRFEVPRDRAPTGAVVAAYAVRTFHDSPPGAVNDEATIAYPGPAINAFITRPARPDRAILSDRAVRLAYLACNGRWP